MVQIQWIPLDFHNLKFTEDQIEHMVNFSGYPIRSSVFIPNYHSVVHILMGAGGEAKAEQRGETYR
jgi:hypothetical protein